MREVAKSDGWNTKLSFVVGENLREGQVTGMVYRRPLDVRDIGDLT